MTGQRQVSTEAQVEKGSVLKAIAQTVFSALLIFAFTIYLTMFVEVNYHQLKQLVEAWF